MDHIWTYPKAERNRLMKWREELKKQIQDRENTIQVLRNNIDFHQSHKEQFQYQLQLLESKIKFD